MLQKIKEKLRILKARVKNGNYAYYFWLFPIQQRKIVVSTHYGRGFSDSPKYIVAELLKQKSLDIVWLVKKGEEANLPEGIRGVRYGTKQALKELATAKIWLDNCRQVQSPPKRRGQIYLQTWHSPMRLKKIEKDAEKKLPASYIDRAKRDGKNCDYMLAGSTFSKQMYQNAFWFSGEVLPAGTPRCDILLNNRDSIDEKVRAYFQAGADTKFILYAPTFRKTADTSIYIREFSDLRRAAKKRFGGKWKVLVRLHPNVAYLANDMVYDEYVLNATAYPDIQELLYSTDLLITDYSSCMFDMAISGKKSMLYTPDLSEYISKERDLYFKIEELPFSISKTMSELVNKVLQFDEGEYQQELASFNKEIGLFETGTAAKEVAQKIQTFI
ncbi:CDP-glycerol glycerophosphotransferase family protein [Listeria booriae]|uniref:Glycerophosphotransferase n=1 Tax=Listeria booriae TaxID=1552123 RepID=A0A7X0Z9C9_9LIST|nr:CDP-glycerol glycerophosphotransferase family protein [Listeria booriae]MBC1212497.1 glycerophosphotransferase [Listeria booriae]MBC1309074.1 glycerophosphotransferase [Listeria booriae]MBC1317665.1 glycerophosphotransferase [Listeria booriae]MBC2178368.1 glycerophosphotransferase [Listeria booriae]MBC2245653.1 glycerophosphotransferase [Listeria booriae]